MTRRLPDGGGVLTVAEALARVEQSLERAGVPECVTHARALVAHALEVSSAWLVTHDHDELAEAAWERVSELVERRCRREPLQQVLGHAEFWSLRLEVGPEVLVPRPESELLVERALAELAGRSVARVADVGTGSGALVLALATERSDDELVATDVSATALRRAVVNADRLGVADRVRFLRGRLVEPLLGLRPFDVMVANLPYVARSDWADLEPEVRDHEPEGALVGGEDGPELILELVETAPAALSADGWLAVEMGAGQSRSVREAFERVGYREVAVHPDLAGIDRVVAGRRPS